MGQNVKNKLYFGGILGALRGSSMIRLNLSCFPAIHSPPYLCTCEIRKQSDKTFLSLNPKYEKIILFFHIWGGPGGGGGPYVEPRWTKITEQLSPHNRADKFIKWEKNNHQFFIYGPQCEKMRILGYSGGGGGAWVAHK